MPEMTTKPIFQSAPPAASGTQMFSGTVAPSNLPDSPNIPATGGVSGTTSSSKAPGSAPNPEAEGTADSFASVLQRQMAQTEVNPASAAEAALPPDLVAQLQTVTTEPVSVEALLPDLAARLSLRDAKPDTAAATASAADLRIMPGAISAPDTIGRQVGDSDPLIDPATPTAGVSAQNNDGASLKKDETTPDIPTDAVAAVLPYVPVVSPATPANAAGNAETATAMAGKNSAATSAGNSILTSALPTSAQTHIDGNKEALPTAAAGLPVETASKSAEFAAVQPISVDAVPTHAKRGESIDPEKSFENLLAASQSTGQSRGTHAANSPAASLPVQTPVGTHGWDGEVGDKLVWMVGRQEQRAELVLFPPQMGRVEVSLSMQDGQASAQFVSANPAVRDALEAALPRLREILNDAGISLGQAQVGAGTGNNAGDPSTNNSENRDNSGRGPGRDGLTPSGDILRQIEAPQWLKRSNGMVDVFA